MTVFIFHGLGGSSRENWFPWCASELRAQGKEVIVPDFPSSDQPTFAKWADHLDQWSDLISEDTIFVGHSLGVPFGLQYLADRKKHIDHFVVVAAPYTDLGWDALREMMSGFPPEQAKDTARQFTIFASDDDPYVPIEHSEWYAELLGVDATILSAREHLWQKEMPEILEALS